MGKAEWDDLAGSEGTNSLKLLRFSFFLFFFLFLFPVVCVSSRCCIHERRSNVADESEVFWHSIRKRKNIIELLLPTQKTSVSFVPFMWYPRRLNSKYLKVLGGLVLN